MEKNKENCPKIADAFELKKTISLEEFKNNAVLYMASLFDSPDDIANIEIVNSEEIGINTIQCDTYIDLSYDVTVGKDYEHKYTTIGRKYVIKGEIYTLNGRQIKAIEDGRVDADVVETETITEWENCSDTIVDTVKEYAIIDKRFNLDYKNILEKYKNKVNKLDLKTVKVDIKEDDIEKAKLDSIDAVTDREMNKINSLFDHAKDFRYSVNSNVEKIVLYRIPYYKLTFKYHNETYTIGKIAIKEMPYNSFNIPKRKEATEILDIDKKYKTFDYITIGALISFVLLSIISLLTPAFWLGFVAILPYVAGIVFYNYSKSKYNKELLDTLSNRLSKMKESVIKVFNISEIEYNVKDIESLFDIKQNKTYQIQKKEKSKKIPIVVYVATGILMLGVIGNACSALGL